MHEISYTLREKLLLIVLGCASLISLFLFFQFKQLAIPEYNTRFQIDRTEAERKAIAQLKVFGITPDAYKRATVFVVEEESKTFLEREVGVQKTASLADNAVVIWHFTTRFFKPLRKEEVSVSFLPNGRLVGFTHDIGENEKGKKLSKAQAISLAETFLVEHAHLTLADWQLVTSELVTRPHRIDYNLVWEKRSFAIHDGPYRVAVTVQGDRIGHYQEGLKVPEAWQRRYEQETSRNILAQLVAESITFLIFGIGMIVVALRSLRQNLLRTRFPLGIGIAASIITLLMSLNTLPLDTFNYDTTTSWVAFVGGLIVQALLQAGIIGGIAFLVIATGESLYRRLYPDSISPEQSLRYLFAAKAGNKSLFIGTATGIIAFAYITFYYIFGRSLGIWVPAEVQYSDLFSTVIPWIFPVFIGFIAAIVEEGVFRLFGIPFLTRLVKNKWLAVLITSVIWAFLHSNYPQSPWFVRGVEISFVGLVFGFLFLRFGILTSITAHFTFNAFQIAIAFYASHNSYIAITSTGVALLPCLVALGTLLLRRGRFAVKFAALQNKTIKKAPMTVTKSPPLPNKAAYLPLPFSRMITLAILALVSVVGYGALAGKTAIPEKPLTITRADAVRIATAGLQKQNVQLAGYQAVTTFEPWDLNDKPAAYLLEKGGFSKLTAWYGKRIPVNVWTVRFFKPLTKNEYQMHLLPDGTVYSTTYQLDENENGANLSLTAARQQITTYLAAGKGYNLTDYRRVEEKAEKKKNRTDYYFTFESKIAPVAKATLRTDIALLGDKPSGFREYVKVPEDWEREQQETSTADFIVGVVMVIIFLSIFILGLLAVLALLRAGELPFRQSIALGLVALFFFLLDRLNALSKMYAFYPTSIPQETFTIVSVISLGIGLVMSGLLVTVLIAMFRTLWEKAGGVTMLPETKGQAGMLRDAVVIAYTLPIILSTIAMLVRYIGVHYGVGAGSLLYIPSIGFDAFLPLLVVLANVPKMLLLFLLGASIVLLVRRFLKTWRKVLIAIVVLAMLTTLPGNKDASELVITGIRNAAVIFGGLACISLVLRNNLVAYVLTIYIGIIVSNALSLLRLPHPFYVANGVGLLFFAALPLILYLLRKRVARFLPAPQVTARQES